MQINAYSTVVESVGHGFDPLDERPRLSSSGQPDESLADHLEDLFDYVAQQVSSRPGSADHPLLEHVRDTQRWYSFQLDESQPGQLDALAKWAAEANAILVVDGAVLDGQGRPLMAGRHGPATGQVPITAEARRRAAAARSWLASTKQVQVPDRLPPVRSEAEVVVRDAMTVALRTLALVLVSDFAASVNAGRPFDPRDMQASFPRGFAALTADELNLFDRRDPVTALQMSWRVEAAQELLWTLGRVNLSWPAHSCFTEQVKQLVLPRGEEAFLTDVELIPISALLDEWEGMHSVAGAISAAQSPGGTPVPGVNSDVVTERLTALRWVLNRDLAWDDADNDQ